MRREDRKFLRDFGVGLLGAAALCWAITSMPAHAQYVGQSPSVAASSGDVAATTATATIAAVAGKTNYLGGVSITGGGATAAAAVACTITGLIGGTLTLDAPVSTVAAGAQPPVVIAFNPPQQATAPNVAIVASCPTMGVGNLHAAVTAWGYQQ